jgi:HK97 family phage major capsid protein
MRIIDKKQTPEWRSSYVALKAEASKVGITIAEKGVVKMTKAELHAERKNLRHLADDVSAKAGKPGLDATEATRLSGVFDVIADLTSEINDRFDLMGIAQEQALEAQALGDDKVPILRPSDSFATVMARRAGNAPPADPEARVGIGECIKGMVGLPVRPEVRNALSEGTSSAGGFTVPAYLLGRIIDHLRARAVVIQAGALTVPLETQQTSIARLATDPLAAWRAENAAVGGTDPTFEKVTFTAQSLACLLKLSRELLEDSVNIETAVTNALVASMALEIDRVAMFGAGTPPEPQGIFGLGTIGSVSMGTNGAAITNFDNLLDCMYTLELANNAQIGAFIMHPRVSRSLRKLKDTTNQPLVPPPDLAEIPQLVTTAVPINQVQGTSGAVCSTVLGGDFSQLMLGIRTELRLQLLTERYADNMQIGLLASMRADVQVAHPESFVKLIGIL